MASSLGHSLGRGFGRADLVPHRVRPGERQAAVDCGPPVPESCAGEGSEFFTDGLTDEILNHLASVPGLKVVARTSTLQFKGHGEDIRAIGRRLNVDAVLEGSVRRSGNRLRITPQFIATADGYHLWSQTFERDDNDLFAIQDEFRASL
jgi:adenylate cyclase